MSWPTKINHPYPYCGKYGLLDFWGEDILAIDKTKLETTLAKSCN